MKVQIRKSVFETNSSSTHAIAVDNSAWQGMDVLTLNHCSKENFSEKQLKKLIEFPLLDTITFQPGEFGWEEDTYTSPDDKASYLITAMAELLSFDEFDDKVKQFEKWLSEEGITMEITPYNKKESIRSTETHKEYVASFVTSTDGNWFYIDHCNEAEEFMCYVIATKQHLFDYLFGDTIIKTGNDNDDSDISFFETEKDEDGYSMRDYPKTREGWDFMESHKIFYKGN